NISAETGRHAEKLVPAIETALESWDRRIPTGRLNAFLGQLVAAHPHPLRGGKQSRILFATQARTRPPRFVIFASGFLEHGYRRFIERRLREDFAFTGSPIVIGVRIHEKRRRGAAAHRAGRAGAAPTCGAVLRPRSVWPMSTPGDNGSWQPQGNDDAQGAAAQPSQDPWAQPPAEQPGAAQGPYGQPAPGAQPHGQQDPYGPPDPAGPPTSPARRGAPTASRPPAPRPPASRTPPARRPRPARRARMASRARTARRAPTASRAPTARTPSRSPRPAPPRTPTDSSPPPG